MRAKLTTSISTGRQPYLRRYPTRSPLAVTRVAESLPSEQKHGYGYAARLTGTTVAAGPRGQIFVARSNWSYKLKAKIGSNHSNAVMKKNIFCHGTKPNSAVHQWGWLEICEGRSGAVSIRAARREPRVGTRLAESAWGSRLEPAEATGETISVLYCPFSASEVGPWQVG
jgi:hypothetical protein